MFYSQQYNNRPTYGDELKVVNGRQSAEQYNMYPNSRVLLMDSTMDRFYLKETDASGMSKIRTFDFTEVEEIPTSNYITMEQLKEVLKDYEFNSKQQSNSSEGTKSNSSNTTVPTQF